MIRLANGMKLKAYPDCVESSLAFYVRWPDRPEIEWLRTYLKQGEVVVDVGANIGLWSLLLADVVGSENILSIEAGRVAAARLKENLSLNRIAENQAIEAAAGRDEKEIAFPDFDYPNTCATTLHKIKNLRERRVRQITLDKILNENSKKIGLIKIDVEGMEPEVLQGAKKILDNKKPRVVLFESFGGSHLNECKEILENFGYFCPKDIRSLLPKSSPQNHIALPKRP